MIHGSNFPSRAKDILLKFLQEVFSRPKLYSGNNEYLWSSDAKSSQILISDANTENLLTVEQRPSLVVTRGTMQWAGTANDAFKSQSAFAESRVYKDLISTEMTINCFSSQGLEAEFLASLVFQLLTFFKQSIRNEFGVHKLDVMGIGPETIISADSKQELSVVPVFCRLTWNEEWEFSDQYLQLNKIHIDEVLPTNSRNPDTYIDIPIVSISVNPASLIVTGASTNTNLKQALEFRIVGSVNGHDGTYRIATISGDKILLLSPMQGIEDENLSTAHLRLTIPGTLKAGNPLIQTVSNTDNTPPRDRPDLSTG